MNDYVPYSEIPQMLGIRPDDTLLVSSDIAKVAMTALRNEKKFVPQQLIDSLKGVVPSGTLLFPAFVDHFNKEEVFDIRKTPPQSGTLSMTAFRDTSFSRTSDPFHSFMVWGKHADDLIRIKNKSTFGEDSVFGFLHRHQAKQLLIDIDLQHSFTFAHYVEEMEGVRYRRFRKHRVHSVNIKGEMESREILFFEKRDGVMLHLYGLHELFLKHGVINEQQINDSLFTLIDLAKSVEVIRQNIRSDGASALHRRSLILWLKTLIKRII